MIALKFLSSASTSREEIRDSGRMLWNERRDPEPGRLAGVTGVQTPTVNGD